MWTNLRTQPCVKYLGLTPNSDSKALGTKTFYSPSTDKL